LKLFATYNKVLHSHNAPFRRKTGPKRRGVATSKGKGKRNYMCREGKTHVVQKKEKHIKVNQDWEGEREEEKQAREEGGRVGKTPR
jgi:predicted secreted Zn-dependent protease